MWQREEQRPGCCCNKPKSPQISLKTHILFSLRPAEMAQPTAAAQPACALDNSLNSPHRRWRGLDCTNQTVHLNTAKEGGWKVSSSVGWGLKRPNKVVWMYFYDYFSSHQFFLSKTQIFTRWLHCCNMLANMLNLCYIVIQCRCKWNAQIVNTFTLLKLKSLYW